MSIAVPAQEIFFYKGNWSAKTDDLLLSNIIRMRAANPWQGNDVPAAVVLESACVINQALGAGFTVTEINIRLVVLRERFTTFNQVVNTTGMYWNRREHHMQADDDIWRAIFERNTFAGAYYYHDEPAFNELASVFGLNNVKVESNDDNGVIVLSDTTEVVEQGLGNNAFSPTDTEEVNSPVPTTTTRVRRKLFTEAGTSIEDMQSSNVAPSRYVKPPMVAPKSSPNASSSASWSPFGRDRNPTR